MLQVCRKGISADEERDAGLSRRKSHYAGGMGCSAGKIRMKEVFAYEF